MLADWESAAFVMVALVIEGGCVFIAPTQFVDSRLIADPMSLLRIAFGMLIAGSVCFRFRRRGALELATVTTLAVVALTGLRVAAGQDAGYVATGTIVSLSLATCFALITFMVRPICKAINVVSQAWTGLIAGDSTAEGLSRRAFERSLIGIAIVPVTVVVGVSVALLLFENSHRVVPIAICGVALLSVALAELAHQSDRESLRRGSAVLGLVSIGMWSSVGVGEFELPLIALSTRWFVAWVLSAAAIAFAIPRLVSESTYRRWKDAISMALITMMVLALGSLLATLGQEAMVRVGGQTEQLSKPLYLGMAATLALLSAFCTAAGIMSGPGFSYQRSWGLSDRQRMYLVVAAQLAAGLTWFHLFLCKSRLADLGLRAYWPYVVMALSFASVGITEWARRRDDAVLTRTLKQTALFMPLIPVIGFWMSGALVTSLFGESDASGWAYIQGRVSYHALLVVAAVYYGVISFLWKSSYARLFSIILGNCALWVILAQTPDWGFLAHPQAWLIPPAVCVLIATHFYRESLGKETASGIRYAATLAIYVTSTADMLIQGIGETIAGPIVLITLALLGAAAGIALRVRPFLYLGTTFVFLGVTSMVWHAQRQIGAVWPWWVFGISAGLLLLVALMALEKNKPKLRRLASSLQQWDA